MNINNMKRRPKLFVNIIGMAIVIKEMNASLRMLVKLKQVNPGLDSATMECRVDGKQEGCVSSAIKWVRIIFNSLNNLNEMVSRIEEVEMKTNVDNVGINKIAEGFLALTSQVCL